MIKYQVKHYINSMKNDILSQEKNINKSIQRLQQLIKSKETNNTLSALAYTASILDIYLQKQQNHVKAKHYYELFQKQVKLYHQQLNMIETPTQIEQRNMASILRQIKGTLQKHQNFRQVSEDKQRQLQLIKQKGALFFAQKLKKIRHFYQEHNIDETWSEIQNLRETASTNIHIKQLLNSSIQKQFRNYEQQYLKMNQFYHNFQQTDGWIYDKQQDNVKLEYKIYQEQRTIAVRMNGQIDIQMMPFMAIICQIDLQTQYIPFVKISAQKKDNFNQKPSRNLKIGFSSTSVPFLADRQCYFYAIGYDRMKSTGSIFIFTKSFEDQKEFQQRYNYIVNHQGKVFLKVYYFCLEYRPISKTRAEVRIVTKANFQLTFLPLFILTLTARNFTFNYFKNIVEKAKQFKGSKWEEKVKANPQMYTFFQSKIDEYFG